MQPLLGRHLWMIPVPRDATQVSLERQIPISVFREDSNVLMFERKPPLIVARCSVRGLRQHKEVYVSLTSPAVACSILPGQSAREARRPDQINVTSDHTDVRDDCSTLRVSTQNHRAVRGAKRHGGRNRKERTKWRKCKRLREGERDADWRLTWAENVFKLPKEVTVYISCGMSDSVNISIS